MTDRDAPLRFHEELLLLILRDEKGTVDHRAGMYHYALAGGILAELLLAGRISVDDDKKKLVTALDAKPLGEPVLDDCLVRIRDAKRRQRLLTWVMRFAQLRNLRHRIAAGLCRRGVLKESEDKILFFFTRKLYPETDHRYEERIVERLRKAIFTETSDVDPRTAALASLASGAELLTIPFDKKELRGRKQRIKQLTADDLLGRAVGEAVRAAKAAAVAACACAASAGAIG